MIKWIKNLIRIVGEYDTDIRKLYEKTRILDNQMFSTLDQIKSAEKFIRERTTVDVEVPHFKGYPATVIVSGKYAGGDFIEIYQMDINAFSEIVDHLKSLKRYAVIRNVDAPYQLREFIVKETT